MLIVDDDEDTAVAIRVFLEAQGYAVDAFTDPKAALSLFKADVYNLALLDIVMKELNGFELYNRLVAIDKKLKVCFMSAFDFRKFEEFQKLRTKVPADCYFEKPFDMHNVSGIIRRELARNSYNR